MRINENQSLVHNLYLQADTRRARKKMATFILKIWTSAKNWQYNLFSTWSCAPMPDFPDFIVFTGNGFQVTYNWLRKALSSPAIHYNRVISRTTMNEFFGLLV